MWLPMASLWREGEGVFPAVSGDRGDASGPAGQHSLQTTLVEWQDLISGCVASYWVSVSRWTEDQGLPATVGR